MESDAPYHEQQTTCIKEQSHAADEEVTVIDPRHPLYGRTFPLLEITNKQYLGRCCVVLYEPPLCRYIPVTATDRSPEPLCIYPLPLNLPSIEQLLATYEVIVSQIEENRADGERKQCALQPSSRTASQATDDRPVSDASADLAAAECAPASRGSAASGCDMSASSQRTQCGEGAVTDA